MTDPRCGSPAGRKAHLRDDPPTPVCPDCAAANARWMKRYHLRVRVAGGPMMVDATGTRRRLHALARIGWPTPALGERLGVTGATVTRLAKQTQVRRYTAQRVAALYDELWDRPGPSKRVADYAARKGWPPPMAYDDETINDPRARPSTGLERDGDAFDEIAMERAMYDAAVPLRPAERAEVVRRLTRAGLSAAQIAQRLDTTPRSVTRWRGKAAS